MKADCLVLGLSVFLAVFSEAICAEQTDACAGLEGTSLTQCRQDRLEHQLQQQQERQNELDKQQREVQQQLESMRLQNESLRKQLDREAANRPARLAATDSKDASKSQDLKNWKADNPWFGSDYAKTQFATRYMKQLEHDRPELAGRELLDAVSTKVNETFGAKH
jgi:septal ring factor EnvC (AmiA/AmiB activator)